MYITVLDFTEGRVFQYKAQNVYDSDESTCFAEQIEDFLIGEGHRMNCLLYTSPSPRDS